MATPDLQSKVPMAFPVLPLNPLDIAPRQGRWSLAPGCSSWSSAAPALGTTAQAADCTRAWGTSPWVSPREESQERASTRPGARGTGTWCPAAHICLQKQQFGMHPAGKVCGEGAARAAGPRTLCCQAGALPGGSGSFAACEICSQKLF